MTAVEVMGRRLPVVEGQTIEEAVSAAGMHPDAFLFILDGRPVPMDTVPPEGAVVRAIRVASGG